MFKAKPVNSRINHDRDQEFLKFQELFAGYVENRVNHMSSHTGLSKSFCHELVIHDMKKQGGNIVTGQ